MKPEMNWIFNLADGGDFIPDHEFASFVQIKVS